MSKTRTIPSPELKDDHFNQTFHLTQEQILKLDELRTELNLNSNMSKTPPFPWDYVKAAMIYRKENYDKFKEAMMDMNKLLSDDVLSQSFMEALGPMKGKFIAQFSANKIDPGSYHTYPHGMEMATDPGEFTEEFYNQQCTSTAEANLWRMMIDVIGAAHDIIQGKAPPINERESAEIFISEMNKMINQFMDANKENLSKEQSEALVQFRDNAVPFLANECLINGTFLLFNSGKRDFTNVLQKVHEIVSPDTPEFKGDKKLSGAIMAVALSDTRRSEMIHVLEKQELLNSVPEHLIQPLEKVLRIVGLLDKDETLEDLRMQTDGKNDRLLEIEGFLLRTGQNIRMTTELAGAFAKTEEARAAAKERLSILETSRITESKSFDPGVDPDKHIKPFIDSIGGPFGEAAFAKALGLVDQELMELAEKQGISEMLDGKLDLNGWQNHSEYLARLQSAYENLKDDPEKSEDLQAIATVLMFIASKPPGHKISPEIYKQMKDELLEMKKAVNDISTEMSKIKWTETDPVKKEEGMVKLQQDKDALEKKCKRLEKDIVEIEKANPSLKVEKQMTQKIEERSHISLHHH